MTPWVGLWVRIEDYLIEFVQEAAINVQGDRYMDPYGTIYILTKNPHHMDKWRIIKLNDKGKQPLDLSKQPSRVDPSKCRLVNSIKVRSVPMDDPNLGVYQRDNHGKISYLQTLYPNPNILTKEKTLYIFWLLHQLTLDPDVLYQDKFGAEYKRVKKKIEGTYTFKGVPLLEIVDLEKVAEVHWSDVRGVGCSMREPSLMDLGPREGSTSHAPQMSGNGGHPITREPSVPHFPIGDALLL